MTSNNVNVSHRIKWNLFWHNMTSLVDLGGEPLEYRLPLHWYKKYCRFCKFWENNSWYLYYKDFSTNYFSQFITIHVFNEESGSLASQLSHLQWSLWYYSNFLREKKQLGLKPLWLKWSNFSLIYRSDPHSHIMKETLPVLRLRITLHYPNAHDISLYVCD